MPRTQLEVGGDDEVVRLRRRYAELKVMRQTADREMESIRTKFYNRMSEHGVDALTIADVIIATITRYDRDSVDAKALKVLHPRIWKRFGRTTPVERVDVK